MPYSQYGKTGVGALALTHVDLVAPDLLTSQVEGDNLLTEGDDKATQN